MNDNCLVGANLLIIAPYSHPSATSFDTRLVDFKQPVTLELNGAKSVHKLQSMLRHGDPELAFTAHLKLPVATIPQKQRSLEALSKLSDGARLCEPQRVGRALVPEHFKRKFAQGAAGRRPPLSGFATTSLGW